jgi:hypothetical protein
MTTRTKASPNGRARVKMQAPGREPTSVEMYPANGLRRDPLVQRELIAARVRHLAAGLDLDGIGVITVSKRKDGSLVILDGQHRVQALIDNDMGEWPVTCNVYTGLTIAQEAALFRQLNDTRSVNSVDRYLKGLLAEDPECLAIDAVVQRHGLRVVYQTGDGCICCVAAMEKVYRGKGVIPGVEALDRAFSVLIAAWGVSAEAVEGHLVQGFGMLMLRYGQAIDQPALIKKLGTAKGGAPALVGQARSLRDIRKGSVADNVLEVAVSLYDNGRRKHRLRAVEGI